MDHLDPEGKCREAAEAFASDTNPLHFWAQRYVKTCPACKEELIEEKVLEEKKD